MLALLGSEQSLIVLFWVTWTKSTHYRKHTPSLPFSCQALEHANPRILQLLHAFLTRLISLFFFNSNSSPLRKVSKRTNEISYSLHEERERQRKGRKEKETKGKEKRETRKMHTSSPAQPNLFSALPRLLVAPQKRTLAAVYEKMDRTIPGFSGAVILPTSMKYKKVTHIYKAIHRILRTLLLTQSIA